MNKLNLLVLLVVLFSTFGCGLTDRFKPADNANLSTPTPAPSASKTPEPEASPSASPFDKSSLGRNWLAFGAGAIVVEKTSETNDSTSNVRRINDESGFYWQTAEGQTTNQSATIELPAVTTLKTFVFDTDQPTYYDGRAAKDVTIEVSNESATTGFQTVLEATLKDDADNQSFQVSKEIPARWVRYTAKNNNGSNVCILTKEISGYGEQEPRAAIPAVSGTYKFEGIGGEVHLKQDGNALIGCYDENEGLLEGTIDGRLLTLTASEKAEREKNEKTSFVAANVTDGGKIILSAWWSWSAMPAKKSYDRLYVGTKTSDKIGNCKHLSNLDGTQDTIKDNLAKELEENGKAILYGINFDFNSDVIRAESKPTLEKVAAILKEKPDWKFSVEGHTDNVGGETFNQTLSEKRAASVVKFLTDAGIAADRLSARGFGLSKPLVENKSEAERAQNRRVELIKQ